MFSWTVESVGSWHRSLSTNLVRLLFPRRPRPVHWMRTLACRAASRLRRFSPPVRPCRPPLLCGASATPSRMMVVQFRRRRSGGRRSRWQRRLQRRAVTNDEVAERRAGARAPAGLRLRLSKDTTAWRGRGRTLSSLRRAAVIRFFLSRRPPLTPKACPTALTRPTAPPAPIIPRFSRHRPALALSIATSPPSSCPTPR